MKRMTDKMAQQMLTFFADRLDINNLPPDDVATFELFQRADTDGILMMESDWDKYDLLTPEGISVEVKTSGYIQTWEQEKLSNIVFGIRPTLGWDSETNTYSSDKIRQADVYVFCVHKHKEQETINPLDISQWDFYVLKTEILNCKAPEQKSASLASILKIGAEKCDFSEIHDKIRKLFNA